MNKVFCVSCGFKNVYEVTKPKFCASCGTAIAGVKNPVLANQNIEVEIEEETSVRGFDLRKMKQDIIAEANTEKTTLTDLWKSATPEDARDSEMTRRKSNLPDGQELIRRSQADCSPVRANTEIDG